MTEWLIIDGYNLIHRLFAGEAKGDLARLRKALLARLEPLQNVMARKITVVFDGCLQSPPDNPPESEIIEVVFARAGVTADSVIENIVWHAECPDKILVVTSDRLERDAVGASGAESMAASIFISMLHEQSRNLTSRIDKFNQSREKITLGDFFPKPP
ncbi:MAG: NYN domain-containing protein [Kiritimatiellae bacterium]|jgi:predicted RNA-binding protein with PIN domain|nr:NYN domain-containing protein [Kiritimatiellia bacterium]